jgi:hypothetical protein
MFLVGKQTFFWLKPVGSLPYRTGSSPAACGGLKFVNPDPDDALRSRPLP